jgi:hypothetical protein
VLLPKCAPHEKLGASYFVEWPVRIATDISP